MFLLLSDAAPAAWTPEKLGLPDDVYADWMRTADATPAESGGLLTRWAGLRASADAGARFDLTPYVNAPTVGAYGPNGEYCVRVGASQFAGGSNDRGGAGGIDVPAPFNANNDGTAGHTVGVYIKAGAGIYMPRGNGGALENALAVNGTSSQWRNAYNNTVVLANVDTGWHSVVYRRSAGATGAFSVFFNGVYVGTSGATAAAQALDQWYLLGLQNSDIAAFFMAYTALSDADAVKLSTWLAGG